MNWVDFLAQVEGWIDPTVERVYAVMDNLSTHTATDVLLFALAHPRWEFVLQLKYAAYLNLIEPLGRLRRPFLMWTAWDCKVPSYNNGVVRSCRGSSFVT